MLNRKTSGYSSPETDSNLSDFDSDEMEEMGFSKLFTYDKDRKRNSTLEKNMDALAEKSLISKSGETALERRDSYFAFLGNVRKSAYYNSLKTKFFAHEKMLPGEYMYFALTTDNVNLMDAAALRAMRDYFEVKEFNANLEILINMREWQSASATLLKTACNNKLRIAIDERAQAEACTFLNLHGANLSGAELGMTRLNYADLGNADLSRANLYDMDITYSSLDNADLSYSTCKSPDNKELKGPCIKATLARNACFNAINIPNIDWGMSDFTGASFRGSIIGYGAFNKTIFNKADFTSAVLSFSRYHKEACSLKEANLTSCKMTRQDYTKMDLAGAKLIDSAAFTSIEVLQLHLDKMDATVLEKIKNEQSPNTTRTQQVGIFQNAVAKSLIRHIDSSNLSTASKIVLYNTAIEHNLFQPDSFFARLANNADRSLFSLGNTIFGDDEQYNSAYATKSLALLESARDALLPTETLHM